MTGPPELERSYRRVLACYPKAFRRDSEENALAYTWPDVIATTVLWLAGLAAALLISSETASPYYQQEPAQL